jgi:DNA helicase MCM8
MQSTQVFFEDGIYMPPSVCITPKCYNKYLEFDRSSVKTIDYQRIKITELDEINEQLLLRQKRKMKSEEEDVDHNNNNHHHSKYDDVEHNPSSSSASTARVPRTMEVEVRDSLVNTCVPGDLLSIVGIVKSIQVRGDNGYDNDNDDDDDDDDNDAYKDADVINTPPPFKSPYHHSSLYYSLRPHDL